MAAGHVESRRPDLPPKEKRWVGKCIGCKRPVAAMVPHAAVEVAYYRDGQKLDSRITYPRASAGTVPRRCSSCGAALRLKPVKGSYSERRACDARCMNATGPNCECQCAGANHGASHV